MTEVHRYREHTIRFTVQRSPVALYWCARGTINILKPESLGPLLQLEQSIRSQQKPKLNMASFNKHKNG